MQSPANPLHHWFTPWTKKTTNIAFHCYTDEAVSTNMDSLFQVRAAPAQCSTSRDITPGQLDNTEPLMKHQTAPQATIPTETQPLVAHPVYMIGVPSTPPVPMSNALPYIQIQVGDHIGGKVLEGLYDSGASLTVGDQCYYEQIITQHPDVCSRRYSTHPPWWHCQR